MSQRPEPPRLAAWFAEVSVPASDRGQLLGDLQERFARRSAARGARSANLWYWRQAIELALLLVPRRAASAIPGIVAPGTVRASVRSIRRSPRTSLAAVITLALGIAAPSAMFALVYGTTSALPGDPEDRVVRISLVDRNGQNHDGVPWSLFEAWSENAVGPGRALASLAVFGSTSRQVAVGGGEGYAVRYWGASATAGLFRMLNVKPVAGGFYSDDPDESLPAVLIREDVWRERFRADPGAIGQVLRVEGVDRIVAGVLPADFGFPVDHRIWMQPDGSRGQLWSVVGRLAPHASPEVAQEQLAATLASTPWGVASGSRMVQAVQVEGYTKAHFGDEYDTVHLVALLSLILVLVTAVNVANVMFARELSRSRETAVRRAIGASRVHVVALTLTEVLFLALGGGALGLSLGRMALHGMVRYLTSQATIVPYWMDFRMGTRSLLLAAGLALVAVAVAGGLPALRTRKADLNQALRPQSQQRPRGSAWAMRWIVGVEVTLSCFLLSISSLVVEQATVALRTGAAFPTQGVQTGQLLLEASDYPDEGARRRFLNRLSSQLSHDPSVLRAALTSALPGKEGVTGGVGLVGVDDDPELAPPVQVRMVGPEFFSMLDLEPTAGRLLSEEDDGNAAPVAVVNGAFVRSRSMGGDVLGRRIAVAHAHDGEAYRATIVGVVDDQGVTPDTRGRPSPGVYLALKQLPPRATYLMMEGREGVSLLQVWHEAAAALDPYLPLGDVMSLGESLRRGHGAATLYLFVFLGLGLGTFLVSLVGLHGVHSFLLRRKVRDIGVRRALGAETGQVLRQSLIRGLRPVWIGLLLGSVPGFLAARSVTTVQPHLVTFLLAPVLLVATSVYALWGPTRRASRGAPMDALRDD